MKFAKNNFFLSTSIQINISSAKERGQQGDDARQIFNPKIDEGGC
jgi:hypothetical protein